jgi:hypothetical protein
LEAIISEISSDSCTGVSRTAVAEVESGFDLTQAGNEKIKIDRNNNAKSDLIFMGRIVLKYMLFVKLYAKINEILFLSASLPAQLFHIITMKQWFYLFLKKKACHLREVAESI